VQWQLPSAKSRLAVVIQFDFYFASIFGMDVAKPGIL
jgi:hypothetical protein